MIVVPPDIKVRIGAICKYIDGGGLGGMHFILTDIVGISEEYAYEIQVKSETHEQVLEHVIMKDVIMKSGDLPPPEVLLTNIENAIKNIYPGAKFEIKTPNLGHNISALILSVSVAKIDNTVDLTFDLESNSIKFTIDPSYLAKLNTDIFRKLVKSISKISDISEIKTIEKKTREELLTAPEQRIRTSKKVFRQ